MCGIVIARGCCGLETDRVNVLVPASPIIVLAEVVVVAVVVVLVRLLRR
jgi:hypothetical protein